MRVCLSRPAAPQGIQTGEVLAASTAIAALELVALLSHVRDHAAARRDFQQLLASAALDFKSATLAPSPSLSRSAADRRLTRAAGGNSGSTCRSGFSASARSSGSSSGGSDSSADASLELEGGSFGSRGGTGRRRGGTAPQLSAALRTRLLRHLLKGPTMKLLCAAAALQQAAPAYNCSVQQRTVGMLRTWAFCAPDIARELVVTPYLLCKCGSGKTKTRPADLGL